MEKEVKSKNYWPHAIVTGIILIVLACAWTIKIALDNPVQMDSYYMQKYQEVDRNINAIEEKQEAFFKRFDVDYAKTSIAINKPFDISFSINDKQKDEKLKDVAITLLVTRPETNEFNKEFTFTNSKDGIFTAKNLTVNKPGRWQLLAKIKYKEYEGFHRYEVFATK